MANRDYWKGKRIAVIGLGNDGVMVSDVKFMIKAGALVSIYDLKSEARLKKELILLRTLGLANYVCGSVPKDDLLDMDLIILSHEYTRDSTFLTPAIEKGIPVEYPETLLFRLAPPVTFIGVLGACGKSSVISMLAPMLETVCEDSDEQGFYLIDSDGPDGVLTCLKKIKNGDVVLVRVKEHMENEFYEMRMSPYVAVFSSAPIHSRYEKSIFDILEYQTYNNYVIASDNNIDLIKSSGFQPRSKMLRTKSAIIPNEWRPVKKFVVKKGKDKTAVIGSFRAHERENAALALEAARLFKVTDETAESVFTNWKPLKGRLEFVKTLKGVDFYNDSASSNAVSVEAALQSLGEDKKTVLIFGGAKTDSDHKTLFAILPRFVHTVVLLPGSGTMEKRVALGAVEDVSIFSAPSIEEAVRVAFENAKKGDRILFSPGFETGGMESSRKDRSDKFLRALRAL